MSDGSDSDPLAGEDEPLIVTPSPRLASRAKRLGIDFDLAATAYHEAGHAVVGFWYGWAIGASGVEIRDRRRCSFSCSEYAYTREARAVVAMAGWLAECKWHAQGGINWNDDLLHVLDAHDWGQVYVTLDDQVQVVRALIGRADPREVETDDFLLAVDAFRDHAIVLVSRPAVWRSIRRVARALLARGKLTDTEVINAIDPDDFPKVSHGRWTTEATLLELARESAERS